MRKRTRAPTVAWRRPMRFECLEQRHMLSVVDFLQESVDLYSMSRNAIDAGSAVIPIYTDFNAGGVYLSSVYAAGVQLNGNDPHVDPDFGGTSSWRMTVNNLGTTGWFQFNTELNRPRNIPEFGSATELRFMAQGDKPGQQLKIKVLGTLPGSAPESSWIRPLSTAWADYSVALPAGVHPSKIDAVQFVLGDGLNQGNGTVYLDQVRLGVDGFDRLRLPQSYRPAGWVSDNPEPAPGTIQERDLKIYPARTYLYDQALAIKALVTAGVLQTVRAMWQMRSSPRVRTTVLTSTSAVLAMCSMEMGPPRIHCPLCGLSATTRGWAWR